MSTPDRLRNVLRAACEDAMFAVAGASIKALSVVREGREAAHEAIARDAAPQPVMMADFEAWLASLTAATAGDIAPWFVPMRDAIEDGMTLHRAPRGLRAVIPIGVEESRARIRREGMFTVRVARAVAAADGELSPDESRGLELLLAALGLPDEDARVLRAEAAIPLNAIELPPLEAKAAKTIVRGALQVAASDGFTDAERDAIQVIATRLSVDEPTIEAIGIEERAAVETQRKLGSAMVDVVRYIVATLPEAEARALTLATVHMAVPPIDRAEALRVVTTHATTPLLNPHDLDRAEQERVLAVGWIVALAGDPPLSLRALLRARHDHAATHLDAERAAPDAREAVDEYVDEVLRRCAALIP